MGKRMLVVLTVLVLVWVVGVNPLLQAQDKEKPDSALPKITKIVIYKHGMGYFERVASVKDDATIMMGFKTGQMKDLLSSFFALDLNGGKITTVSYDSKDPIDKQLENILIRVPENAALTQFLAQLKGARVEVKVGNDVVRGNILGIEPVNQKTNDTTVTAYKFIILNEAGEIQPFNLLEVSSLKLLDEPIQKDLKRVLDIYLNAKYTDRKQVKLTCTGKGERDILMGYLIETPIWKTSYRLILDENKKPYLQGWAIIENTTDEDWDDVKMSFVAGNPISFNLDLYTSYYPQRPVIDLTKITPLTSNLVNVEELAKGDSYEFASDETGVGGGGGGAYGGPRGGRMNTISKGGGGRASAPAPVLTRPLSELLSGSISSIASGMQVGELFAYESKSAVSIGRGKAAMVPIITENIDGSKVLYFRAVMSPRLMNAFYLTNSTKLKLETGPVTLFEGSTSVGEGLLRQSLSPGMNDIIPYAVETGCTIEILNEQKGKPIHKCAFTNGVMTLNNYTTNETVYKLANRTTRNQTLYLDHPRAGGYTLVEPAKPDEEVAEYYRFKIDLPAGANKEFKIVEQSEMTNKVYVRDSSLPTIEFYLSQPYLSEKAKAFLGEVRETLTAINKQQQAITDANAEYARLNEDQVRYRENMKVLSVENPTERDRREKYLSKLDKGDERMDQLKAILLNAQETQAKLRADLAKKIEAFND